MLYHICKASRASESIPRGCANGSLGIMLGRDPNVRYLKFFRKRSVLSDALVKVAALSL